MFKKINTLNKKIQLLLLSFISLYFLIYFFAISPKIKEYLISNEYMYYEMQLKKISEIIHEHAMNIKSYEENLKNSPMKNRLVLDKKKQEISKIFELIRRLKIKENGYILLIDKQTNKYVHPDNEINNKKIQSVSIVNNQDLFKMSIKAYETKQPMKYMWHKKGETNKEYKKIAWVSYNEYFNFLIVSAAYEEDIEKEYIQINKAIVVFSVFTFLIIYIIAARLVNGIITPLNNLILNINTFKEGNYEKKSYLKINSNDEFELLNNEFNEMKNKIVNNINNLENQILLRTKELERQLYIDELTQLQNNKSLIAKLKRNEFSSIIILNINKFRDFNELYGYEIGNLLINKIASLLKKVAIKHGLKLFKLEGITFAFFKEGHISFDTFSKKIVAYQRKINNQAIYLKKLEEHIFLNTTMGISICHEMPLKSAYTALNNARREKKEYCFFNNSIDEKAIIQTNNLWNNKIKYAISTNNIIPFFQAIVDENYKVLKYETLMRLKEEKDIFHSPYKFLAISKKTNQYQTLSSIIVQEALKNLKKNKHSISINLSYRDTQDENIKALLNKYIKNTNTGKNLTIEILEDDQILNYEKLNDFVLTYKKLGVKFAIDDFGAGYSNLLNILKLKPDFLKIDGSLIKNIDTDEVSFKLVKSIVKFSEEMGIKVIAEYVHNKTIFDKLKKLNIYGYQGYYFHEPQKDFLK